VPFYEITYETGRSSVARYADEAEAQSAIKAHHDRAVQGLPGGPVGAPAERVVKVREFDKHPNDLNPDQTMGADVLNKELSSLVKGLSDDNGVVDISRLAVEVRALSHPMVTHKETSFDSNFVMKPKQELSLTFLEGGK